MIVAIEGGDQAGKLTQSRMLARALKKRGVATGLFHFPDYATPIGRMIAAYLAGRKALPPQAIHCLLAANRWERLPDIESAVGRHDIVIMNRYYHSNIVYGMANGLKEKWLEGLDAGLPRANMVILLDVSQEEAFERQATRRDRFERDRLFSQKISSLYRRMAKKKGWKVIDAARPKSEVHAEVLAAVIRRCRL